jgi:glycosyltransferase involved in cell wall biosynthesis
MLLSVIVPVFNEEKTIQLILNKLYALKFKNFNIEIIVVDDCSSDNTVQIIETLSQQISFKFYSHKKNKGKGAAIRTGVEYASGDYCVVQDADLEYDPEEFQLLMKPVFKDNADAVYGSRFMGSQPHRILFFWHSIGNKILTVLSNSMTNLNLTDMETCYKLIRTSIFKSIKLKENRFGFEPEITAKLSKVKGIKIYEVGVSYYGRTYEEGKKIGWKDGVRAIYCIIKYNLFG